MLIVGIDPGLKNTGYAIIDQQNNKIRLIDAGYIKTSPDCSIDKRLLKIFKGLDELIKKYSPDAVVLEKLYSHYKHPLTACLLGHARGAICLCCAQNNIELFEYSATRIKKSILGVGNASKQQIQQMVLNILGLKNNNAFSLDVTDAISIAIAHSYITKKRLI